MKTKAGIVSYGAYLPKFRITTDEIAKTYNKDPESYKTGLGIIEKTVPALDEDTITNAVNAARQTISRVKFGSKKIGAIYVGSESHPYAVKPSAVVVGQALGIENDYTAADTEFACKAGTAGMQVVFGLIEADRIETGLAIGSDTAQGAPGDALEFSAASGAAAFLLGTENLIAKLIHTSSFTSDTPDFWRREHQKYPSHGGRFTGEPAYFRHVTSATKKILKEANMKIEDFDHVVFHMPNGKFPRAAAKMMKVTEKQLKAGLVVAHIGNTYSACSMLGLVSVLDQAKSGEKILVSSYGSGAGSDSFIFEVTKIIDSFRKYAYKLAFDRNLAEQSENKEYLSYGQYIRHTKTINN